MKREDEKENSPVFSHILSDGFPLTIDIARAHDKHDEIHEKRPNPDRTPMNAHPIKRHSKSIHENRNEVHLGTNIGPKCLNRSQYMGVSFLKCEEIGSRKNEKNPKSSTNRYSLSKEK